MFDSVPVWGPAPTTRRMTGVGECVGCGMRAFAEVRWTLAGPDPGMMPSSRRPTGTPNGVTYGACGAGPHDAVPEWTPEMREWRATANAAVGVWGRCRRCGYSVAMPMQRGMWGPSLPDASRRPSRA